jgi:hypothetical protein
MTVDLMERMYQNLYNGASKAAALRMAQFAALRATPQLHPAFWGAFQLVGDASPFSIGSITLEEKESIYASITATA